MEKNIQLCNQINNGANRIIFAFISYKQTEHDTFIEHDH